MISEGNSGQPVPSMWEQTKSFFIEIPFGSRLLLTVNCATFVFQFFEPEISYSLAFNAPSILFQHQWYRMFTSAFIHYGVLHILFNMLWVCYAGKTIEKFFGTIPFIALFMTVLVFTGIIMLILVTILQILFGFFPFSEYNSYVGGFSGVVFAFMQILYVGIYSGTQVSLFGLHMPAKWIPLTYLIITKLIMANSSFFGHLSGMIAGQLVNSKLLRWFLPSQSCCESVDRALNRCTQKMSSFLGTTSNVAESEVFGPKPCLTNIFRSRGIRRIQRQEIDVARFEELTESDKA
mmetsp:Transcript_49752/g.57090  ORF Transcript_49752/g.57090 Transcript_49752/m.57090 type:complete len:292 (+) Transcript_49752:63-938(+)